jgi:hypothetical protein
MAITRDVAILEVDHRFGPAFSAMTSVSNLMFCAPMAIAYHKESPAQPARGPMPPLA